MTISSAELGRRAVDAITQCAASVVPKTESHARPLVVSVQLDETDPPADVRIFVWNITGGGTNRSPNERRVQTTRPADAPLFIPGGSLTLLLGYHEASGVFAAWDSTLHESAGTSSSLQIQAPQIEEAAGQGFAQASRAIAAGDEVVFAFTPENMGLLTF